MLKFVENLVLLVTPTMILVSYYLTVTSMLMIYKVAGIIPRQNLTHRDGMLCLFVSRRGKDDFEV